MRFVVVLFTFVAVSHAPPPPPPPSYYSPSSWDGRQPPSQLSQPYQREKESDMMTHLDQLHTLISSMTSPVFDEPPTHATIQSFYSLFSDYQSILDRTYGNKVPGEMRSLMDRMYWLLYDATKLRMKYVDELKTRPRSMGEAKKDWERVREMERESGGVGDGPGKRAMEASLRERKEALRDEMMARHEHVMINGKRSAEGSGDVMTMLAIRKATRQLQVDRETAYAIYDGHVPPHVVAMQDAREEKLRAHKRERLYMDAKRISERLAMRRSLSAIQRDMRALNKRRPPPTDTDALAEHNQEFNILRLEALQAQP